MRLFAEESEISSLLTLLIFPFLSSSPIHADSPLRVPDFSAQLRNSCSEGKPSNSNEPMRTQGTERTSSSFARSG